MATVTRADVAVAMSLILRDPMVDQFRRDSVMLNILAVRPGANAALTWNPKFTGRSAGGPYAEGADMSAGDYDSHVRAQAVLSWASYRAGAKVSGLAMAVTSNGNQYVVGGDLFDEELRDAVDKMAMDVSSDIYAGDPTASPVELAGAAIAIDGTAGTFAGLASATYAEWLASENTIATASLSKETIRQYLIRPVQNAARKRPDVITCPPSIFDTLIPLFDDKVDTTIILRAANNERVDIALAAGARALNLDGTWIIEDRHCTASTLYAWSLDDVELQQVPAATPQRDPKRVAAAIKMLTGVDIEVEEVEKMMRRGGAVAPTIEFLAQTGDAYQAMVKAYIQLKWRRRNSFAKLVLS